MRRENEGPDLTVEEAVVAVVVSSLAHVFFLGVTHKYWTATERGPTPRNQKSATFTMDVPLQSTLRIGIKFVQNDPRIKRTASFEVPLECWKSASCMR